MLPGKTYTPEEIVRIALGRKWLILLPLVLGLGIAVWVGRQLPDQYRSETLIMIMSQRIPDGYVRSTVTGGLEERLTTLNEQILSRSRLERIILDFNLYPAERSVLAMEDVVQRMRGDIRTRVDGRESFRISYVGGDAKTVQKITARLASLFMDENTRDRQNRAEDTNQFLDAQLEEAKRQLVAQEKKLQEYRQTHSGELPSQTSSNMQVIQNAQMQLQAVNDAEDRDRERRLLLERQLAAIETPDPLETAAEGQTLAQQLEAAQAGLRAAELRLKPDHPDIKMMKRTIRDLEAKIEAEAAAPAAERKPRVEAPRRLTPAEIVQRRRTRDLKEQISDIDRQLGERHEQVRRLESVITAYQAKLDALPKRESELVELTRDYSTLQASYASLLERRQESKVSLNLERRNVAEQFRVLDPPTVAERPFSPNRPVIDLIGAMVGLGLGVLLVGFLEYRDVSFRTEADILRVLNMPVLALVPDISSSDQIRKSRRAS
jgi:polysaccharide chain length determinant protein (PEP-CTERM system associated)